MAALLDRGIFEHARPASHPFCPQKRSALCDPPLRGLLPGISRPGNGDLRHHGGSRLSRAALEDSAPDAAVLRRRRGGAPLRSIPPGPTERKIDRAPGATAIDPADPGVLGEFAGVSGAGAP